MFKKYIKYIDKILNIFKKKKVIKKDKRRAFTNTQKIFLWYNQDWKCNICKNELDMRTVKYDHIIRQSEWWKTDTCNWQALCANCHSKKTFEENLLLVKKINYA